MDNTAQPDYKSIDIPSKLSKQEETNLSALKQEFIMTVFKNLVTTDEGKPIISKYSSTGKAQELWKKIKSHQKHSLSLSHDSVKDKQPIWLICSDAQLSNKKSAEKSSSKQTK